MTFDFYPGAISAKSRKYRSVRLQERKKQTVNLSLLSAFATSIPRPRQEQMEVESQSKIRWVFLL